MDFSKVEPPGPMVLLELISALLLLGILSSTNLQVWIKQERIGIIRIIVCFDLFPLLYHTDEMLFVATQYCDGLRGAFVVYDPDDPYKSQ
jgi:hypothetical protein